MKTWKCSVCGEMIQADGAPLQCPICGVGSEFFEEVKEPLQDTFVNTDKKIIIIGNGIAGFTAAKTLRQLDKGCRIDLFTLEPRITYDRTKLSKKLYELQDDTFFIEPKEWYEKEHIHIHTDCEIMSIEPDQRKVQTVFGGEYRYDDLILAMGAHSVYPPIPNIDLNQIYALRTMSDAFEILKSAKPERHALIVGGGILGLEIACTLADAHTRVEVVEAMPSLMARQLDAIGSELLMAHIEAQKIHVHTNTSVTAFHGISRVETVELSNGKCRNVDYVIVATGIQPSLSLLKKTSIAYEKAILVNAQMETNIEHIYACGNVCSFQGEHKGLWNTAKQQGEIAAYNIAGMHAAYTPQPQPVYFTHDDFSFFMIGDIHQMDQELTCFDEEHARYEKYCYKDHQCSGVLMINCPNQYAKGLSLFQNKAIFPKEKGAL